MSTFEGPILATKTLNKIGHYTDWVIGHVHIGALGWNGFITFGMIYYLLPIMWRTKLWSTKLANWHFWLGTLGIIFYAVPLYIAGFTQGLMWKQFNPDGTLLYKNWLDTVTAIIPYYNGQPYNYTVSTTGICGTPITLSGKIDQKLTVGLSPVPAPCDEFFLKVSVSNFVGPYTIAFITSPAGFNPASFNEGFPSFSVPSVTFGGIGNGLPGGIYVVKITDACGNIATSEIDLKVPEVKPSVKIE